MARWSCANRRRASRNANEPRQFERDVVAVPDEIEVERRADRRPARHAGAHTRRGDLLDLGAFPTEIGDRLIALADEARDLGKRADEDDAEESPSNANLLTLGRARHHA